MTCHWHTTCVSNIWSVFTHAECIFCFIWHFSNSEQHRGCLTMDLVNTQQQCPFIIYHIYLFLLNSWHDVTAFIYLPRGQTLAESRGHSKFCCSPSIIDTFVSTKACSPGLCCQVRFNLWLFPCWFSYLVVPTIQRGLVLEKICAVVSQVCWDWNGRRGYISTVLITAFRNTTWHTSVQILKWKKRLYFIFARLPFCHAITGTWYSLKM